MGLIILAYGQKPDFESREKYDAFVKDNYPNIKVEKNGFGKDGGVEYCISSEGIGKGKFNTLVTETKDLLSDAKYFGIKENSECRFNK